MRLRARFAAEDNEGRYTSTTLDNLVWEMKVSKPWEQEHFPFFEGFVEMGDPNERYNHANDNKDKIPASIAHNSVIFVRARNNKNM